MSDFEDFGFRQSTEAASEDTGEPLPPPRTGPSGIMWGIATLGLIGAMVIGYLIFRSRSSTTPAATPAATTTLPVATASATPVTLPALDQSDPLVFELLQNASHHPLWAAWLSSKALVRTAVVVVDNIANDENPAAHLSFLAPKGGFEVIKQRRRVLIDPKCYSRYDTVADAIASLDAKALAHAVQVLEPLLETAYRDLGHPEGGFRRTLDGVLATLIKTPLPEGDVVVVPVLRSVVVYEYADPRLETLALAQKQLLRMGPGNTRKVQAKLRELMEQLGPPPGEKR